MCTCIAPGESVSPGWLLLRDFSLPWKRFCDHPASSTFFFMLSLTVCCGFTLPFSKLKHHTQLNEKGESAASL